MKGQILVVEDEGLIALHYTEMLGHAGFEVPAPLPSGEAVLEYLAGAPHPDLILMDIGLAGSLNGIETARRVRRDRDIPVIFLTAYSDGSRLREMAEVSPCRHLVKPFTEQELVSAIQEVLDGAEKD
jgi:CheY-like chemotaxis protein